MTDEYWDEENIIDYFKCKTCGMVKRGAFIVINNLKLVETTLNILNKTSKCCKTPKYSFLSEGEYYSLKYKLNME